jgi:hypothetical protein
VKGSYSKVVMIIRKIPSPKLVEKPSAKDDLVGGE